MHTSRTITRVAVVVGALFTLAVIVAAWSGRTTVAVLLGLNGVLLTSYFVRHRMRMRLIYGRHPHGAEN